MGKQDRKMIYNPITLTFPGQHEKDYEQTYFNDSKFVLRFALILAIGIYILFGYLESISAEEYRKLSNIIHFALIIPALVIIYFLSFAGFFIKIWQWLISSAFVFAAIGKIVLLTVMPENSSYYTGLILIYSAGYFVFRLRFIYATITGWLTFVLFNLGILLIADITINEVLTYNFFYFALNLFGMLAAYNHEFYNRKNYFLSTQLDRKEAEKLREQVELAKKTLEFKQNFLANMSHEIRTPLTGLVGMIEILRKTNLDKTQIDYANTLKQSTENLHEIINQVLDYSNIEAGKVKLNTKIFRVQEIFINTRKLFSSICDKDIAFEMIVEQDVPIYIKADRHRIIQVINNLISNAVKFTSAGKIELKVKKLSAENTGDIIIRIEVTDTGQGIKPEKHEKVFVPFAQIDETDTREYDGTGLGLSICKKLVEMHGGEIGFRSEYKTGSTFWFTFKAKAVSSDEIPSFIKNDDLPGYNRSLKILLAEDKAINQKVVSLLLESMGHSVTIVNNGKEAIDVYEQEKEFDMIIMDIQMPVMDGITATQTLKAKYNKLPPIVGLSANAFDCDYNKYINLGMDDYMTKPFKDEDFRDVVNKFF